MAVCKVVVTSMGGKPVAHSYVALAYYDCRCGYSNEYPTDEKGCATLQNLDEGIADVLVDGVIQRQRVFVGDGTEIKVVLP